MEDKEKVFIEFCKKHNIMGNHVGKRCMCCGRTLKEIFIEDGEDAFWDSYALSRDDIFETAYEKTSGKILCHLCREKSYNNVIAQAYLYHGYEKLADIVLREYFYNVFSKEDVSPPTEYFAIIDEFANEIFNAKSFHRMNVGFFFFIDKLKLDKWILVHSDATVSDIEWSKNLGLFDNSWRHVAGKNNVIWARVLMTSSTENFSVYLILLRRVGVSSKIIKIMNNTIKVAKIRFRRSKKIKSILVRKVKDNSLSLSEYALIKEYFKILENNQHVRGVIHP